MIGRIRTVKPEIFSDEKLWDLCMETGLPLLQAFQGLWCYADREGRFEWRPRALKTKILPYWDGDFARALEVLEAARYIVRYSVDGRECGVVRNFSKHQRVNLREARSTLPPPPDTPPQMRARAELAPVPDPARGEGNGRELNGREGDARAVPDVPGLDRVGSGGVARSYTMPSKDPPKEYLDVALMGGVKPEQARSTWKHYYGAGLPEYGVERLFDWLTDRAIDRTNQLAKVSKSGPRAVDSDLDTTGAAVAFRVTDAHREYAGAKGLDVTRAASEYRKGPTCARLDTIEQERDFMNRLRCWFATGTFIADGPLPRPPVKAKEARA